MPTGFADRDLRKSWPSCGVLALEVRANDMRLLVKRGIVRRRCAFRLYWNRHMLSNVQAALRDTCVLVVEDIPNNLAILRQILLNSGSTVLEATNAQEALDVLQEPKVSPDAVLLDVMLPGMSGFDLCEQIKKTKAGIYSRVPILFISALHAADEKVRAFSAGGVDYITKPLEPYELIARVAHQIKTARRQHSIEKEHERLRLMNVALLSSQLRVAADQGTLHEYLPAQVLDGKYKLLEKIGSGGFGVVYKGLQLSTQRPVAIKVFCPSSGGTRADGVERFRLEAIFASRVDHTNAVAVLDSGISSEGIAYLVMELLIGHTLYQELLQLGTLPLTRTLEIINPVCSVLIRAHAAGVIHRDIKPENIFLHAGPDGEVVKVLDFGISKLLDAELAGQQERSKTMTGMFMGTPAYMSPERISGGPSDVRSDVYSIGVLLYEMLCGRMPFARSDAGLAAALSDHLTKPPQPLRAYNAEVPESLERVVLSTLAKDPAQRPQMDVLLVALQLVANSLARPLPQEVSDPLLPTLNPSRVEQLRQFCMQNDSDLLPTLIRRFAIDAAAALDRLQSALKAKDNRAIRFQSHYLRSSSANMGGERLADLCSLLEELASEGPLLGANALFEQIVAELSALQVELAHYLPA